MKDFYVYKMTDADKKALVEWFAGPDDDHSDSEGFTTTIEREWDDNKGWVWTARWHTVGVMMGTGSEGTGLTLAEALAQMEANI